MTIDWFTFVAQILNFLVLIWLLKRFLYGPIINAMDQRESRIAARLSEAAQAKENADHAEREYRDKLEDLDSSRKELLATAGRDVERWRIEHLQQSKDEVQLARTQWQQSLVREKQALLRELQLDVTQHATDVSQHLLRDLADERLQFQLVRRFLKQLAAVDSSTRHVIATAHRNQALTIETSHELAADERERIADEIRQLTSHTEEVEFRTNSDLVCGIELHAPGCKLAWSIRDALAEVESNLIDAVDAAIPDSVEETGQSEDKRLSSSESPAQVGSLRSHTDSSHD